MGALCEDFRLIKPVRALSDGCDECMALGDGWVHLRMCMLCGYVGCCDASPNMHARRHFQDTGHSVVSSLEAEEDWVYCYRHDIFADQLAITPPEE
jgi:uncharacterized UBP type Zn finger protein